MSPITSTSATRSNREETREADDQRANLEVDPSKAEPGSNTRKAHPRTSRSTPKLKKIRTRVPASLPSRLLHGAIFKCMVFTIRYGFRVRPRLSGMEQLDRLDAPWIIACNHVSLFDSPAIHALLPHRHSKRTAVVGGLDFFAPREDLSALQNVWRRIVVWFIRSSVNAALINRSGGDYSNLEQIEDLLSRGWNLVIFPEATRSRSGELGRLRLGVAELAKRSGCPVVPTHISGTNTVLPVGSILPKSGTVSIRYGEPMKIDPDGSTRSFIDRLGTRFVELAEEERLD
ncbi:MAG: 1-acyl-sn-glycerol-3-phosphate acyltransferase [Phycisphaerales bacterium]|nr:1-acyl-sn-glycerol-3-phosphate acyltransferase [Phycisphaerales bacterium]